MVTFQLKQFKFLSYVHRKMSYTTSYKYSKFVTQVKFHSSSGSSSTSELPTSISSSASTWFSQFDRAQISVHFRPFATQGNDWELQDRLHLQARSSSTASGGGFFSNQSILRTWESASVSIFQPIPTGLGMTGYLSRLLRQIHPWKFACMACLLRQSLQGGNKWDSISPFLTQNKLYLTSSILLAVEVLGV